MSGDPATIVVSRRVLISEIARSVTRRPDAGGSSRANAGENPAPAITKGRFSRLRRAAGSAAQASGIRAVLGAIA